MFYKAGLIEMAEEKIKRYTEKYFSKMIKDCSVQEQFEAVVHTIMDISAESWRNSFIRGERNQDDLKTVYYFSMEFLIGKLLENYLVTLDIKEDMEASLKDMGVDVAALYETEPDPGLGNGGLGRLAACFMDSMASVGIKGVGIGLRYQFGLFKQKIVDGVQTELPDTWLEDGYPWEICQLDDSIGVKFGGTVNRAFTNGNMSFEHTGYSIVNAVPYVIPIIGQSGETVNKLVLFKAEPTKVNLDMEAFNRGDYAAAMADKCNIEAITSILYPDDSSGMGRKLRLRQEYLMVSAGISMIIKDYKEQYGKNAWGEFPSHVAIHINDTHPTLCIPELLRVLIDEEGLGWDEAWKITKNTISFTNHTVLPEASEHWSISLMQELMPRVYMMIEEIDRRFREVLDKSGKGSAEALSKMAILWDNEVRMANLSVIGSHSVNGVAELHTDILKKQFFKDFYTLKPDIFNNKTNGISHRRFMMQSNPGLTALIDSKLGKKWHADFYRIEKLMKYADDEAFLKKLRLVKKENKERFAAYVEKKSGIILNTDSVFDIQVKRFHAYKRQLLNALKIMYLYNDIKAFPDKDRVPVTFIFSGKAAQGYAYAKEIIRLICSIEKLVNNDPVVNRYIQVVFVENFCVSNAQLIYPAADISEQISTAGKEASGTGNMKFMMNGAITLGTLDGANIEITQKAGMENEFIFGLKAEEIDSYRTNGGYNSRSLIENDERLMKIVTQLADGTISQGKTPFWPVYDELMKFNDEFFVAADFSDYLKTFDNMLKLYRDKNAWTKMSLVNIAKSAYFSSDRTIREYADEIWHAEHE